MKAVFLCAGEGTRMHPLSYSRPKHLIPIANKPLLRYNVESVIDSGIDEIGLVVSPGMERMYREELGKEKWGAKFEYIHQEQPLGLAHAVNCARDFVGDEPFLVYLGDNWLEFGTAEMIQEFREGDQSASILLVEVEDPTRFGVAEIKKGKITNLVEKPDDPPSNLAIVGSYIFDKSIFRAIDSIEPSPRGEYEITDAIRELINFGGKVYPQKLKGRWFDVGRPEDAIEANRFMLSNLSGSIEGNLINAEIKNREQVVLSSGSKIENSIIEGPAIIGEDVEIKGAKAGPDVSIARETQVIDSYVRNSILMKSAYLKDANLSGSIIGNQAHLDMSSSQKKVIIGDQGQVRPATV